MNMVSPIRPVQNIEAEAAVIGAMLRENRHIDGVADVLTVDDFAEPIHAEIFAAIIREASMGRAANPITIKAYFDDCPNFASLGGVSFLGRLAAESIFPPRDFAMQVADMAARRRVMEGLKAAVELAQDANTPTQAVIACAEEAIAPADDAQGGIVDVSATKCFNAMIDALGKPQTGVKCTSIPSLDTLLGPLLPKQLVIVAGRPGMGKTALALSYALGAAQTGHGVLFVSLEMSGHELAQRMAADLCFDGEKGIPYSAICDGSLAQSQIRKIAEMRDVVETMPLQIVDTGRMKMAGLSRRVQRWKRRMEARGDSLDLVIVDYLQLLSADGRTSGRYEAISEVSQNLKAIAKEHGVTVMALAQLSREVEKRPDRRPQLSDLKDSGQIEQDADKVLFLLRDEYYLRQDEPEKDTVKHVEWEDALRKAQGKIDLICAKRRDGVTGTVQVQFHGGYQAVRG